MKTPKCKKCDNEDYSEGEVNELNPDGICHSCWCDEHTLKCKKCGNWLFYWKSFGRAYPLYQFNPEDGCVTIDGQWAWKARTRYVTCENCEFEIEIPPPKRAKPIIVDKSAWECGIDPKKIGDKN